MVTLGKLLSNGAMETWRVVRAPRSGRRDTPSNLGCEEIRDWLPRQGRHWAQEEKPAEERELVNEKEQGHRDEMGANNFLMQPWLPIRESPPGGPGRGRPEI